MGLLSKIGKAIKKGVKGIWKGLKKAWKSKLGRALIIGAAVFAGAWALGAFSGGAATGGTLAAETGGSVLAETAGTAAAEAAATQGASLTAGNTLAGTAKGLLSQAVPEVGNVVTPGLVKAAGLQATTAPVSTAANLALPSAGTALGQAGAAAEATASGAGIFSRAGRYLQAFQENHPILAQGTFTAASSIGTELLKGKPDEPHRNTIRWSQVRDQLTGAALPDSPIAIGSRNREQDRTRAGRY